MASSKPQNRKESGHIYKEQASHNRQFQSSTNGGQATPASPSNNEDGYQSSTNQLSIPYLPKSPSKAANKDKSSQLQRNNYNKYLKVSEFIKVTTTSSSAKPKNKKGLLPSEAPRYYEQMSLKHQVYLPNSGSTLTN